MAPTRYCPPWARPGATAGTWRVLQFIDHGLRGGVELTSRLVLPAQDRVVRRSPEAPRTTMTVVGGSMIPAPQV